MRLLVSFDRYQENWYVGELYYNFLLYLQDLGIDVVYKNIKDLEKEYKKENNDNLSIFSIYNLIITNKDTNKTFIHSLSDYAPAMMDDNTGILNFDVSAFSCSSNLNDEVVSRYTKYKIIPSFYILENFTDLELVDKFYASKKTINACYFNGLCYGHRSRYKDILSDKNIFHFKDKNNPEEYRDKVGYFGDLSNYKYGISLDGAAKICYRDIEYFGLGILCLRERLNIITHNPIIEEFHYLNIFDDDIQKLLYDESNSGTVLDYVKNKINNITEEERLYVTSNAREWYINNCTKSSQIKLLHKFLIDANILN